MIISLTKEEYEFFLNENFLNPHSKNIIKNIDIKYNLVINEDDADAIREECGEKLQLVGFDKNSNPTKKGLILESLIDKFFVG